MNKFVCFLAKILKAPVRLLFPTKLFGTRDIPPSRCVMVGNHISGWDPIILYAYLKNHVRFMYKSTFESKKFLRWALHGLDFIPVRRGDADVNAVKSCIKMLEENKTLAIFPEGSRNPDVDVLQQLKTGATLIALKTKSPIRPFYVWEKARPFRRNFLMVGEQFTLDEFYDKPITKEMLNDATEVIRTKMQELRSATLKIIEEKGIKRRKRTKKELKKISEYYCRRKKRILEE